MHYQSLNAALEQYSGNLTHHPASPNSLALHIDRQTQGYLKLHTPDGISLSLTYQDEPVFWSFFSHDLYDVYLVRSYAESWQAYQPVGYIGSRVNEHIARRPAAEQGLLWNKFFIEQLFHRTTRRPQHRTARHWRMALRLPPSPTSAATMGRMLARHRRGAA